MKTTTNHGDGPEASDRAPTILSAADYGRTLQGLSVNLLVTDIESSLPFYVEILGLQDVYHDRDVAALAGPFGARIMLHADHTYATMPLLSRATGHSLRGLGVEIRILGIDPNRAEARAREHGCDVLVPTRVFPHGWRECHLSDPSGYVVVVGVPVPGP